MTRYKYGLCVLTTLGAVGIIGWSMCHYYPMSFPFLYRATVQSPKPMSIGVVDINKIKSDSKVFQKFNQVLGNLNATIHAEILSRETKLLTEYEQFKKREEESKEPTQDILKQKVEIDKKHAALEKVVRTRREELEQKETRGLMVIKKNLQEIMDNLGKSHGLKIILNKSIGDGNRMVESIVLFCNEGLDLTNEVIKHLDEQLSGYNFQE